MERLLDITPGSVSVLGLMNDKDRAVRLLVDRDLLTEENFGCHPCINTSSLRFVTKDLFDTILPALDREPTYVELPWVMEE
jgi:Ala-tRNA(Pro) deacylase